MIEVRRLLSGYPGRVVLEDVTLDFRPGEVLAILGPNGCGKSTLLRTVLGLLPGYGGEILYSGAPIESLSPRQIARQAAYLPQDRPVPNITARRMVLHGRFPYLPYPRRYSGEDHAIVRQAMEAAGAWETAEQSLPALSGGQRQKVYLAMALAQNTETIFMDEPTTFLDIRRRLEVMASARRLAGEGRAVVLVLHDLSLALEWADRLAVLREGRLAFLDSPEEAYASGVLEEVFGVRLGRTETDRGWRYYCDLRD